MSLFDRAAIDEEVWEELEELLISADVGVATASKIIDTVKKRASEAKLDGSHVRALLQEEMTGILSVPVGGTSAVADNTYTVHNDGITSGQITSITTKGGIVTAVGVIP